MADTGEMRQEMGTFSEGGECESHGATSATFPTPYLAQGLCAKNNDSSAHEREEGWHTRSADDVAVELSEAVAVSHRNPDISDYTRRSLTALLMSRTRRCAAIEGVETELAFDDWQMREIDVAFLSLAAHAVSLAQLSRRCGLSACHFARKFKRSYGTSLHQHVIKLRIDRARDLLRTSQQPICQIALRCGFSDQSSFTRRFTSIAGVSPAYWRRQYESAQTSVENNL